MLVKVPVLWHRPSPTPKVCWILFGGHISPCYPILISNFAHPVVHKLLVFPFSSYPVERNCTVWPTVNLVDRISFQGFSHVSGHISCHMTGDQLQAWYGEALFGQSSLHLSGHPPTYPALSCVLFQAAWNSMYPNTAQWPLLTRRVRDPNRTELL